MISARILADSISPDGVRLTTLEITLRRFVLAELNTHRVFSRNSASSRAIPVEKMLERVKTNPAMPVYWGANQKGMQAGEELSGHDLEMAKREWLWARDKAVEHVERLLEIGLHKQLTNRLLEPWMWQTVIVSATEWENFFNLRCHPDAQPEIRVAAEAMREAMENSRPKQIGYGEWHLPLIRDEDRAEVQDEQILCKISAGRCARVSYLTHDGRRDLQADIDLCERLVSSGHMSPLEHQARPVDGHSLYPSNFYGWHQFRKSIPGEDVFRPDGV